MSEERTPRAGGLSGLRVVTFESRRATEMAGLIAGHGGEPVLAPAVAAESVTDEAPVLAFAEALLAGGIDAVVLLTAEGTRRMAAVIEARHPRPEWLAALARTTVVARSPKAAGALRALGGPTPGVIAAPPHTTPELLAALAELDLADRRVAVQEYGAPNPELLAGLVTLGARPLPVPVYRWQLPADTGPLRSALRAVAAGQADVLVFTSPVQVTHLLQVAADAGLTDAFRSALPRLVVAVVGPSTRRAVLAAGLPVDLEPAQHRMGYLVHELAERARDLLAAKAAAAR